MRYAIHEANLALMSKKVKQIQNKCKKYGCEFSFKEVGEEFREVKDSEGNYHIYRYVIVEAEGHAEVGGWEYIAALEHTNKGNIITSPRNIEIPQRYYDCKPVCEHCGTNRFRKNTYIIRNIESGEYKQIGASCLRDFTGGMNINAIASYENFFEELGGAEHYESGYRGDGDYVKTADFLRYVAETIRHFGYVKSTGDKRSTKGRAIDYYKVGQEFYILPEARKFLTAEMESVGFDADSDKAKDMVEKALAWLDKQDESNNYMHNLKTACALEYQGFSNLGIVASLFPSYDKDIERQCLLEAQERVGKQSMHVGKKGERITVEVAKIKLISSWDNPWSYNGGMTNLYKITDTNDNVYTWKTSEFFGMEHDIEKIRILKGSVKEHSEYRGVKQTELTRCKVIREDKDEPVPVEKSPAEVALDVVCKEWES